MLSGNSKILKWICPTLVFILLHYPGEYLLNFWSPQKVFFWGILLPSCFNYAFWPVLSRNFALQILMWSIPFCMEVEKSSFSFIAAVKSAVPYWEVRHVARSSTAFLPPKGKWSVAALASCQVQIQVLGSLYYLQTLLWKQWSSQPLLLEKLCSVPFEVSISIHPRGWMTCTGGKLRHEVIVLLRW